MSTAAATPDLDGLVLPEELERALAERVAGVRRTALPFPGTYDSCVLEVTLASGRETRLFLKDLASCPDFKADRAGRRARELSVYRDVLSGADLGTARFYGCPGDRWLLLEYVEGLPVKYCDIPDWHHSVRWLGRMHATLAGRIDELRQSSRLPVNGERGSWEIAAKAMRSVHQFSPSYERRLARALHRWYVAVEAMTEGPLTLVHGAYRPEEVLIQKTSRGPRVCPVDWENAALGSTLVDFANFTEGFEGNELDLLFDRYREEAATHGWETPVGERARFAMACHRLQKNLTRLAHAAPRGYPSAEVEQLLRGVEQMAAATLD